MEAQQEAVAPHVATYGSVPAGSRRARWRERARAWAVVSLCSAAALLYLTAPGVPGASELEDVVSLPVMGTGGGPTTRSDDSGSEVSQPVMGAAMKATPIDGPTVHLPPSAWKNYSIDYNVFALHVLEGGINDADSPGALPRGRNEWENNFKDFDFKPSDRHDGAGEQAEAIMSGVQHYGEVKFNGYPRPLVEAPSEPHTGGSTLAGGAGTAGINSALAQADSIVEGATAGQEANTAAAAENEASGAVPASSQTIQASAEGSAGEGDGGNEKGGEPSNSPDEQGASANGDNSGGGGGEASATDGGTETGPATGNNCYLLPDLCPQYSLPAPGVRGAGADVAHVEGEPKEEENDGSQSRSNPEANIETGGVLGAFVAPPPPDPPPPTPAPYTPNLVFDTSMDNGAEGMGESIQVDTSKDAVFVGGAPIAAEKGRPTQLAMGPPSYFGGTFSLGHRGKQTPANPQQLINAWSNGRTRLGVTSPRPTDAFGHGVARIKLKQQILADSSGEFEDSGEEDTSMDADLQKVDDQLQGVLPMYDHRVGTVNFGSRGMTDKRNDFLEGTSGSRFGSPATSAPASTMGKISELLGFIPTGLRVLGEARVDALNQKLDDVRIMPISSATRTVLQAETSGEFEDSGEEDTSMDADLQKVDDQLQGVLPMYDHRVGTVNFGSRGMTDKRNDFLEGTSGSQFGSPATSAPGSS